MPPTEQMTVHHTAIVVTDLERSRSFYERFFGAELEHTIPDMDDPSVAELHQLAPGARFTLMFLGFGNTRIELIEFASPSARQAGHGDSNDVGLRHLAFACPDVRATYAEMKAAGVEFTREPYTIPGGSGPTLAFCRDPDGTRIEILQSDGH